MILKFLGQLELHLKVFGWKCSRDLNSEHLNSWWNPLNSEFLLVHYSNGALFRCPITMVPWISILDRFSNGGLINQMGIWILNHNGTRHLNTEPFDEQTNPYDLNTKLARYSDPHFSITHIYFWGTFFIPLIHLAIEKFVRFSCLRACLIILSFYIYCLIWVVGG